MSVSLSQITFEHHREALGIGESQPRISWRFEGNVIDWEQSSYDLEIERDDNGVPSVYNVDSTDSIYVPWPGEALGSAQSAQVRVRAHGLEGQPSTDWSKWASVETGLLNASDWDNAVPIAAARETEINASKRPIHFRNDFTVDGDVTSARLYITALGVYEAAINGKPVGDHVLAPGWQSYNYRHVYDTYDVTELISNGDNAFGAIVGEGWYAGRLGYGGGSRNIYGDTLGLLALLVVKTKDGKRHSFATNEDWHASLGPIITSEIYDGEKYDARLELDEAWSSAGYNHSDWMAVKQLPPLKGTLVPADGPPVRKLEEVRPVSIHTSPSGKTIVDFGQNLVGWLRLSVSGEAGTNISLHHAEVLEDGELSLRPLRNATAADTLILADDQPKIWEPRFTFHGFRYAQVDGVDLAASNNAVTAIVVHSDMGQTGWFECSNPLLNKFHSNVRWSMKGNFLSIPTDCPQRDERMGWTGDAHAFASTANYLYDTAGFWRGWHKDIWFEQQRNGTMVPPITVPVVPASDSPDAMPAAVWGDVVVANPYQYFKAFGDLVMLAEQYESAQAWIDTGISRNEVGLWNRSTAQFGDWLDPLSPPDNPGGATTSKYLVADSYLIRMTELLANISQDLGRDELAEKYRQQHDDLLEKFRSAWVSENGTLANETQTAYAMAVQFGLLPDVQEAKQAGTKLRQIIADNDYLVGTGFAGTPPLSAALTKIGGADDFYRMLLQTEVPSWLYQVAMNGTTTWERWNSLEPNGSVNAGEMTSFNHYAFGSVSDWIHTNIGGLSPAEPGWKRVNIAPIPGGNITSATSKYISRYGEVAVKWYFENNDDAITAHRNGFHLEVQVPPNTRATVTVPSGRGSDGVDTSEPVDVGSGYHEWFVSGYKRP